MRGLNFSNERTINCKHCGKEIKTFHPTKCFCDKECKWKYENKFYIKPIDNRITKKCIYCQKEFFPLSIKHPHQRLCSKKCRDKYNIPINKEKLKIWRIQNKKHNKEIDKKSYNKYRKKRIQEKLNYRKTPKGRLVYLNSARIYNIKRHKILKNFDTQLSIDDIAFIKKRDKNKCVYCGKEERLTLDHVLSLKDGGKDDINNVVVACLNCNCSKRHTKVLEWCEEKGYEVPEIIKLMIKNA